jgi:hypothetical protein
MSNNFWNGEPVSEDIKFGEPICQECGQDQNEQICGHTAKDNLAVCFTCPRCQSNTIYAYDSAEDSCENPECEFKQLDQEYEFKTSIGHINVSEKERISILTFPFKAIYVDGKFDIVRTLQTPTPRPIVIDAIIPYSVSDDEMEKIILLS